RVVAIGIGLGGTVALRAADAGLDLDGIVLWASPLTGRTWLRAQRARHGVTAVVPDPELPPPPPTPPGIAEPYGFAMPNAGAESVTGLTVATAPDGAWPDGRPRPAALAVSRGTRPDTEKLAAALAERGIATREEVWDGWDRMHDEPHLSVVPE